MPKNTIISNFRKVPKGFLFAAALFLLTESFLYIIRPALITDFWNKFLINEHELIDMREDYEYLIMGDSVQKTGINPTLVSDKVLNLGLPGAKPLGQYLMLRRYLKKHEAPKAIFLYIDPEPPRDSLLVILRYFVNIPEFISIWGDLTWRERGYFILRYWVSLDMRKVGLNKRDEYPDKNSVFVNTMKKNQGYMPNPRAEETIKDNHFLKTNDRYQADVAISERDIKYLDKLAKLTEKNNIKLVFLGFLLPKELHDILEKSGFNDNYLKFFKNLKKKYPGTYFVKEPILYLENRYFGDMSHVNNEGSAIYTVYFKNQAFAPMASALKGRRPGEEGL